jgi:hypothetical protein
MPGAYDGKKIDLGRTNSPVPMEGPKVPKKSYPTLFLDGLSKDNPLVKKDVGTGCDAGVTLHITSKTQESDGKWSVRVEVRDMWSHRAS